MQHYQDVLLDRSGNAIAGATITVTNHLDGLPAVLYADYAGTVVLTSIVTDLDGSYSFYFSSGRYDFKFYKYGLLLKTQSDVFVDQNTALQDLSTPSGASMVGFNPTGTISATTVQTAIVEINTDLSASSGATLIGYIASGTGAIARTIDDKEKEVISVMDFIPPGTNTSTTDCTTYIQAAITASYNKTLLFPASATYLSGSLTITSQINLVIDGTLKYNTTTGIFISFTNVDNCSVTGMGEIDLNDAQHIGIYVNNCDYFTLKDITFRNMLGGAGTSGISSAFSITNSSYAFIDGVSFFDIKHGTAPSPYVSQPRAISIDICTYCAVDNYFAKNIYTPFCIAGSSNITVNNPIIYGGPDIVDNGFYLITSDNLTLNNISLNDWTGEPIVFSTCTNSDIIGGKIINSSVNSIGMEKSTNITIDGLHVAGQNISTIVKTRTANTGYTCQNIVLKNIVAVGRFTSDVIGFYNGNINNLTMTGCTFDITYDATHTLNNRFLTITNNDYFTIENNVFIFKEDGASPTTAQDYEFALGAPTSASTFKNNTLENKTGLGRFRVFGPESVYVSSDNLYKQSNVQAYRNKDYALSGKSTPSIFYGSAIPTAGTGKAGDILLNTSVATTVNQPLGWFCRTAGSPGTWAAFGIPYLTGSAVYNPPSIANGASTTTAVTVTGAAIGDFSTASFGIDLAGISLFSYVSAANTVTVVFTNNTGATVDLAQSRVNAMVMPIAAS